MKELNGKKSIYFISFNVSTSSDLPFMNPDSLARSQHFEETMHWVGRTMFRTKIEANGRLWVLLIPFLVPPQSGGEWGETHRLNRSLKAPSAKICGRRSSTRIKESEKRLMSSKKMRTAKRLSAPFLRGSSKNSIKVRITIFTRLWFSRMKRWNSTLTNLDLDFGMQWCTPILSVKCPWRWRKSFGYRIRGVTYRCYPGRARGERLQ